MKILLMRLIKKYDRPVPRYTSYPTVPYWQTNPPTQEDWLSSVRNNLSETGDLSLYVHLPFCEQLCTYCGCNKRITKNHRVEQPYLDTVLKEWSIYRAALDRRPRLKELHLGGGTPTFFSPASLVKLINGILADCDVAEDYSFSFEAHPESTTEEHLTTLASLGFNRISIGVQDFSQRILKIISRKQTTDQVYRTVGNARKAGYASINFDVIYGLPTQTKEDVRLTIAHIEALQPERIAFYGYAHVPWMSPGQRAYDESHLPRGAAKWQLYRKGYDMLTELGYQDIGLDHFALPEDELSQAREGGWLHRNFMGYTVHRDTPTIALGCSGIGDSGTQYVQNIKGVEDYRRVVLEEGRLPLFRGHELSPSDRIVKQHILNLMCTGTTDWREEDARCEALNRAVVHWDEMATDGILYRSPYQVSVTDPGKPFLRNICLPLDDHFWANQPEQATFSQSI